MRDRRYEQQRYQASGLNLVVAAIVLWNTVYLERVIAALENNGETIDRDLLKHLSPLGWDHIPLPGTTSGGRVNTLSRGNSGHCDLFQANRRFWMRFEG